MNWESIQQFFRDNPRAWLVGAAALLTLALSIWGIWGDFSLEFGQFFAATPPTVTSFDVNPKTVAAGGEVTITWAADADSCRTVAGTFSTDGQTSGTRTELISSAATGQAGFRIECTRSGSSVMSDPVFVTITQSTSTTPSYCSEGFWDLKSNEDWSPDCVEGQSNINPASPYWVQANVNACHPKDLHLVWRADHRNKASCDPRLGATESLGKGITTDVTGFRDNDLPNGVAGTARMTYDPAAFNCGSIHMYGAFWSGGQGQETGDGWHLVFNYGKDCGAATPLPGPKPGAAVLKATCTGNQATLTWNIPAGATENVIRKIVNGATQVEAFSDPTKTKTTFTETFVPTTQYLHKSSPSTISNIVQCPSGGATSSPAVTPTPVYPPLQCAPINQTVVLKQIATVTATGGSGTYQWDLSGSGVQQGGTATTVDVSYTVSGQKVVRVSSGGQTATCVVTVTGTGSEALSTLAVIKRGINASTGFGGESSAISVNPNEVAQFTISITNNGTVTANSLRVLDSVPLGMTYRTGSTTINGQAVPTDTITTSGLAVDALEPGANVNIQWAATANATSQLAAGPQQSQPRVFITATDIPNATADMSVTVYGSGFAGSTGGVGSGIGTAGVVETGPGDVVIIALVLAATLTLLYSGYTRSPMYRRHEADAVSRDQGPMDFRS